MAAEGRLRRVRITAIDDDVVLNRIAALEHTVNVEMVAMRNEISQLSSLVRHLLADRQPQSDSMESPERKRKRIRLSSSDEEEQVYTSNKKQWYGCSGDLDQGGGYDDSSSDASESIDDREIAIVSPSSPPLPPHQRRASSKHRLDPSFASVRQVWDEWKVGGSTRRQPSIEKLLEQDGVSWRHDDDKSLFRERQLLVQEIEYMAEKSLRYVSDVEAQQAAIEALDQQLLERGYTLHQLALLVKAWRKNAKDALGQGNSDSSSDDDDEREPYIAI